MKRVLKAYGRGIIAGVILSAISLLTDYLKLPIIVGEMAFFFCGIFYCAYIIDKD